MPMFLLGVALVLAGILVLLAANGPTVNGADALALALASAGVLCMGLALRVVE